MTTTAPINSSGFTAEPPISCIVTPGLKPEESARLLACINDVRAGRKVYFVRMTYHKVTDAPPRIPPQDYVPDPALRPCAHEGMLVQASINRKGALYLRLHDEARRPPEASRDFGYTCVSLDGIESFKVLGERPGPVAQREQAQREAAAPAPTAPTMQQILAMQAQGMFMMGQAMFQMAQTMLAQIQPPVPQPQPPQGPQAQPVNSQSGGPQT
jgi:hypothetical protein